MSETRAAPWWETLAKDFPSQADGTELDAWHPFKVGITAGLDRGLRTLVSALLVSAAGAGFLLRRQLAQEFELLRHYQALADQADAGKSFPAPTRDILVHEMPASALAYRPNGVPHRLLAFESPFRALHPELRKIYAQRRRNRQAFAQHWYHEDGPRPTLIVVHGFGADHYAVNACLLSLRRFYERGYDLLLFTLPFHGYRAEHLSAFSGSGLFAHGLSTFNEAMAHAVHDLRVYIGHLLASGAPSVGITGLSIGGYTSALLAAVDSRLAYCIPNAPVVSPADLAMEWQPIGYLLERLMRRQGIGLVELRHLVACHSPLTYAPKLAGERMLIVGGAGDRMTPPRHVRLLHAHWPGSRLHWYPGNHVLHLGQRAYQDLMLEFMDRHSRAA
jgi:pimeloyl-ACP methyl ester carboxylesterase